MPQLTEQQKAARNFWVESTPEILRFIAKVIELIPEHRPEYEKMMFYFDLEDMRTTLLGHMLINGGLPDPMEYIKDAPFHMHTKDMPRE